MKEMEIGIQIRGDIEQRGLDYSLATGAVLRQNTTI
jgi:hypothetical protein